MIKNNQPNGKIIYIHRNDLISYAMGKAEGTVGDATKLADEYLLKKHITDIKKIKST